MAIHLLLGDVTVRKASVVGSTPPRRSDISSRAVVAPDGGASAKNQRAAAGGGSGVSATIEATEAKGGRPDLRGGGGGDSEHGWRKLAENWRDWEELAERWDDGQEAAEKLAGRRRIRMGGVGWSADAGGGREGMLLTSCRVATGSTILSVGHNNLLAVIMHRLRSCACEEDE
uniref:Uncharacterized protein n=1 Tax=Oryza glumipatula TaxID=40148 RepID=A0A0D9ZN97_9ORYZ